MNLLEKETAED